MSIDLLPAPFDVEAAWSLHDQAVLRLEPFGALLYHFGTRRLSFLKSETLAVVVRSLSQHPSALAACAAAGVVSAELPAYERSLAALAASQMICRRSG